MSGVIDGQAVDQAVTNAAFLAANGPTTGVGSIYLADPLSGPTVVNVQTAIDVLLAGVGGTQSVPATAYGSIPSNTIPSGSTHLAALIALANLFSNTTGHRHSGTEGDGGPIYAVSGVSVSGSSVMQGGVIFTATGLASLTQGIQVIAIDCRTPNLVEVLASGNGPATAGIDFGGGAIAGLSYLEFVETPTPPTGAAGYAKIWMKTDDHVYTLNSASTSHRVDTSIAVSGGSAVYGDVIFAASGGVQLARSGQTVTVYAPTGGGGTSTGVGAFNIAVLDTAANSWAATKTDNQNAESAVGDWAAYADTAGTVPVDMTGGSPNTTIARNTSSPLDGAADFKVTVSSGATRQGEGVSLLVNLPTGYRGQPIRVRCPFATTGTIAAGDFVPYAYDVTNSTLLAPSTVISGISGAAGTLYFTLLPSSSCAQLRIGIHIARASNTGAVTINFDDFMVEPDLDQANVPMSDWATYTPTFTGFGTVTVQSFWWRRVGDSVEISGAFTSGTSTATEARLSLPNSILSDSTKIPAIRAVGEWYRGGSSFTSHGGGMLIESNVSYLTFGNYAFSSDSDDPLSKVNGSSAMSSGNLAHIHAFVPISGWSSGGGTSPVLSLSDWASFTMNITGTTSNPAKGTTTVDSAMWRRVGDTMEILWNYKQTAAGSAGSGKYLLALPSGYSIDTSKQGVDGASGATAAAIVGVMAADTASGSRRVGSVNAYDSTHLAAQLDEGTSSLQAWGSGDAPLSNSDIVVSFFARVPIAGWTSTSSGTLTAPRSQVYLDTHAGYGATNTKVPYFTNSSATGAAMTLTTNDSTSGARITINESGVYSISFSIDGATGAAAIAAIAKNATGVYTTAATSLSTTVRRALAACGAVSLVDSVASCSVTEVLSAGDIINPQTDGGVPNTSSRSHFTITKVSN